jgi:phenylalanyl-tRNA synthetase beta chain
VKGDVEALLAPLQAEFEAAEHPALHPGRCARILVDGREVGVSANCIRAGASNGSCRTRPAAVRARPRRRGGAPACRFEPVPKFQPAERDLAVIVADRDARRAAAGHPRRRRPAACCAMRCCSTSTSRSKHGGGRGAWAAGEKSMAVRLTLASPDATLTDDQIESAVRAVVDSASPASVGGRLRG